MKTPKYARLNEVAEGLTSDALFRRDKQATLDALLTLLKQHIPCESSAVFLFQREDPKVITLESSLTDAFGYNFQHGIAFRMSKRRRCGLTSFLATENQTVRLYGEKLLSHPCRVGRTPQHLAEKRCLSILTVPIYANDGNKLGYIKCENRKHRRNYSESDAQIGEIIAQYIAMGIQMHDHFDNFCKVVLGVPPDSNISSVLGEVLSVAKGMIHLDAGVILLHDQTTKTLRCASTLGCGRAFSPREFKLRIRDTSVASHVFREQNTYFHEDIANSPVANQWGIRRFRIRGPIVGAPIIYRGKSYGAIVVWGKRDEPRLHKRHENDLLAIGELAGPLIEQYNEKRKALAAAHSFVHNLHVGVFRKDNDLKITYCNRYYQQLLQIPIHKIIGRGDHQLFLRELANKFRKDDRKVLKRCETLWTVEQNIDAATGLTIYVDVTKRPLLQNSERCGLEGTFLRLRPETFDLFTQAERIALSASWEWDVKSDNFNASINYWNLLKIPAPQTPDKEIHFLHYFDAETRAWLNALAADKRKTQSVPAELYSSVTLSDGSKRIMLIRAQRLTKRPRTVIKVVGTMQDVTQSQEDEIQRSRQQAIETFRETTARVAHDTLAQFATIRGSLEALQFCELPGDADVIVSRALAAYVEAFDTLTEFTSEARESSRAFERYNVNKLLEEFGEIHGIELAQLNIRFERNYCNAKTEALLLVPEMRRVLANIVQNAIEAMPEGGTLSITTRTVSSVDREFVRLQKVALHGWIEIDIANTGIVIVEEDRERIFEQHFSTKNRQGAGYGLKSVKRLMSMQGGWITLLPHSESCRTTFRLLIPAVESN